MLALTRRPFRTGLLVVPLFLLLHAAATHTATAQTVTDTQLWTAAGVKVTLPSSLRFEWSHALRFAGDISRLKSAFHELALRYRAGRFVRLRGGYRYYMVRNGISAHRFFGDVLIKLHPAATAWAVGYRGRLQTTTRPDPAEDLTYVRNKLFAELRVRPHVTPFAAFELYYRLRSRNPNEFRRYRIAVGADVDVATRTSLTAYYMLQREINVNVPELDHVLRVELTYRIDAR